MLNPILMDGVLHVTRLPHVNVTLNSLTVEPSFWGQVARYVSNTNDPRITALRSLAGGRDGTYNWQPRGPHRVLIRRGPHGQQLVIPPEGGLRQLLMEEAHAAGHFGSAKLYNLLCARVFWPRMRQDVTNFVKTCAICQV